jgi:putative hydrolase of the HAD superfamily
VTGTPLVKNLIFDLGGVILDLSVDHTLRSFAALSGTPQEKIQEIFHASPGFNDYEKGRMDDDAFRNFIRDIYGIRSTDADIDESWNAMLRGIPAVKLTLLNRLKSEYRVFLLSNTNGIHLNYINTVLLGSRNGENRLDEYFHRAYYSHRMLKRKPDADIFEQVLEENGLIPGETLFLDDNTLNIRAADALSIQTVHVTTPDLILDYFHA